MRRATRQRVCGVVVNVHPNVARSEYDCLKAILTNCKRLAVTSQNREGHPTFARTCKDDWPGSPGWRPRVEPKLRGLLEAIAWT
jgi:hypothetical protein